MSDMYSMGVVKNTLESASISNEYTRSAGGDTNYSFDLNIVTRSAYGFSKTAISFGMVKRGANGISFLSRHNTAIPSLKI